MCLTKSLIKVFLRERIDTEHQRSLAVNEGKVHYGGKGNSSLSYKHLIQE